MPKHALVRASESTKRGKSAALVKAAPAKTVTLSIAELGKKAWDVVKRAAKSTSAGAKARKEQKKALELLADLLAHDPRELSFALDVAADLVKDPALKRFLREACTAATKKPKKKRVVSRPAPKPPAAQSLS
jgi:hypothetical protein